MIAEGTALHRVFSSGSELFISERLDLQSVRDATQERALEKSDNGA